MSVFDPRVAFKPFEYPEVIPYKDAINHSYWLISEWNFVGDIHDFNTALSPHEQQVIKNTLLAISQIEVSVKKFWTNLGNRFPKAEFEQVGVTFGECHIDGTEILTPTGWVDLKDVKVGDEVMQIGDGGLEMEPTQVIAKYDKKYSGEMYEFSVPRWGYGAVVTPNHRLMLCEFDKSPEGNVKLDRVFAIEAKDAIAHSIADTEQASICGDERLWMCGYRYDDVRGTHMALPWRLVDWEINVIPHYDGIVRCVSVPSEKIVTRYNGKTFIGMNSEVRHSDAYSHLLEILSLNTEFEQLLNVPEIQGRVDYLTKYLRGASDNSHENYTLTLALFSIFIENVSLFSQFAIIKSFNKHKNVLKDVDNVVQATQKEELVHAMFGVELINIIKREFPEWFDETFYEKLYRACRKAYDAEVGIINWIYGDGELDFLPKHVLQEFIKDRFNESLVMIGGSPVFEIDKEALESIQWFIDEIYAETNFDFFHKRSVGYSKKMQPITSEDLF